MKTLRQILNEFLINRDPTFNNNENIYTKIYERFNILEYYEKAILNLNLDEYKQTLKDAYSLFLKEFSSTKEKILENKSKYYDTGFVKKYITDEKYFKYWTDEFQRYYLNIVDVSTPQWLSKYPNHMEKVVEEIDQFLELLNNAVFNELKFLEGSFNLFKNLISSLDDEAIDNLIFNELKNFIEIKNYSTFARRNLIVPGSYHPIQTSVDFLKKEIVYFDWKKYKEILKNYIDNIVSIFSNFISSHFDDIKTEKVLYFNAIQLYIVIPQVIEVFKDETIKDKDINGKIESPLYFFNTLEFGYYKILYSYIMVILNRYMLLRQTIQDSDYIFSEDEQLQKLKILIEQCLETFNEFLHILKNNVIKNMVGNSPFIILYKTDMKTLFKIEREYTPRGNSNAYKILHLSEIISSLIKKIRRE